MTRTARLLITALVVVAGCGSSDSTEPTDPPVVSSTATDVEEPPQAETTVASTSSATTPVIESAPTTPTSTAPTPTTVSAADVDGGVDGPIAYWESTDSEGGEEALVEGPLVVEDDCVFVGLGVEQTLMLWTFGTTWDSTTESVDFPNGETAVAGDIVSAGGGFHSLDGLEFFTSSELVTEALERCAPVDGVFVVQGDVVVNNPYG